MPAHPVPVSQAISAEALHYATPGEDGIFPLLPSERSAIVLKGGCAAGVCAMVGMAIAYGTTNNGSYTDNSKAAIITAALIAGFGVGFILGAIVAFCFKQRQIRTQVGASGGVSARIAVALGEEIERRGELALTYGQQLSLIETDAARPFLSSPMGVALGPGALVSVSRP